MRILYMMVTEEEEEEEEILVRIIKSILITPGCWCS